VTVNSDLLNKSIFEAHETKKSRKQPKIIQENLSSAMKICKEETETEQEQK